MREVILYVPQVFEHFFAEEGCFQKSYRTIYVFLQCRYTTKVGQADDGTRGVGQRPL